MGRKHLLLTDTHLDDNPGNEYRWRMFDHIHSILDGHSDIESIFHLGDAWDRKDRFSSGLVNRLLSSVAGVGARVPFWVMKGNHDDPMAGPAFFEFVNGLVSGVRYVTSPTPVGKVVLLPFTKDPFVDWRGLDLSEFRAAFLHVTPDGAVSESGYQLSGRRLPDLPAGLKLYTGDVHQPQTIRNWTVVGCPHPIKFGDTFQPRMLLLDADTFDIAQELRIDTVRKITVDVRGLDDLRNLETLPGDQVKIRVMMSAADVDAWGATEAGIANWATEAGVDLSSLEVTLESEKKGDAPAPDLDPEALLREFAADEGVSDTLLELGLELMREARE